jgi:hypothetical protein
MQHFDITWKPAYWAFASPLSAAALTASMPENSPLTHVSISSPKRSKQLVQNADSFSATAAVESEAFAVAEAGSSYCATSVEGLAATAGVSWWSGGTSSAGPATLEVEAPEEVFASFFLSLSSCFALFSLNFLPIVDVDCRCRVTQRSSRASVRGRTCGGGGVCFGQTLRQNLYFYF